MSSDRGERGRDGGGHAGSWPRGAVDGGRPTSGNVPLEKTLRKTLARTFFSRRASAQSMMDEGRWGITHINKHVLPQAPSPTMTSFRRISAISTRAGDDREEDESGG